jgi:hypothetical protein
VAKLIEKHGRKRNLMVWREMLNDDCPKRDARITTLPTTRIHERDREISAIESILWGRLLSQMLGRAERSSPNAA